MIWQQVVAHTSEYLMILKDGITGSWRGMLIHERNDRAIWALLSPVLRLTNEDDWL